MVKNIFTGLFICEICDIIFNTHREYLKHERLVHQNKLEENIEVDVNIKCNHCNKYYRNLTKLLKHLNKCPNLQIPCQCNCGKSFNTKNGYIKHKSREIKQIGFGRSNFLPKLPEESKFLLSKSAFKSFLQQYELFPEETLTDVERLFIIYRPDIEDLIQRLFTKLK